MLLRRGRLELGRRVLHQWAARQAAAAAVSSSNQTSASNREEDRPRTAHDAGERREAAAASAARWSGSRRKPDDDLCNPDCRERLQQPQLFFTDWGISQHLPVQFSCQHVLRRQHLNLGSSKSGSELLLQQRCGISTSAHRNAGDGEGREEPVRSPLSQAPGPLGSGGQRIGVSPTRTAQAVLTGIRQSPQKLNLVAEMVRGMRVEDALTQMAVSVKRAAKTVSKVVHSAQANAVHNFGLEKDRLVVSEAFVGKDRYLKRVRPHGKGKAGKLEHPRARLTVVVKEMSVEQETDLARLRVFRSRGTRMTRSQARLVPHRVLATQWSRQRPPAAPEGGEPATGL